jgi:hypothetical protein
MGVAASSCKRFSNRIEGLYFAYVLNVSLLLLVYMTPSIRGSFNQCAIKLPNGAVSPTAGWRGADYLLDKTDISAPSCLITRWNVAHALTYMFYGFYCPRWKWLAIAVGVLFELVEWLCADCQDLTDVIANTIGCLTGAQLARWLSMA